MSIRKLILISILIVVSLKYGWEYLNSDDFQKYGDRKKAVWTCYVDLGLGAFCDIMSDYKRSNELYTKVLTRCPENSIAEKALFERAVSFENLAQNYNALADYENYLTRYPQGVEANTIHNSIERIHSSR